MINYTYKHEAPLFTNVWSDAGSGNTFVLLAEELWPTVDCVDSVNLRALVAFAATPTPRSVVHRAKCPGTLQFMHDTIRYLRDLMCHG